MSAIDAFRAAYGEWSSVTAKGGCVSKGIQHDAAAIREDVSGSALFCLKCRTTNPREDWIEYEVPGHRGLRCPNAFCGCCDWWEELE